MFWEISAIAQETSEPRPAGLGCRRHAKIQTRPESTAGTPEAAVLSTLRTELGAHPEARRGALQSVRAVVDPLLDGACSVTHAPSPTPEAAESHGRAGRARAPDRLDTYRSRSWPRNENNDGVSPSRRRADCLGSTSARASGSRTLHTITSRSGDGHSKCESVRFPAFARSLRRSSVHRTPDVVERQGDREDRKQDHLSLSLTVTSNSIAVVRYGTSRWTVSRGLDRSRGFDGCGFIPRRTYTYSNYELSITFVRVARAAHARWSSTRAGGGSDAFCTLQCRAVCI